MDIIYEFITRLPPKQSRSPSGWISVNAPCCHHCGHKPDKRKRGGFIQTPDGGFSFHCFNCSFKAGWKPGQLLSKNAKLLLKYLGASDDEIIKINFAALRQKQNGGVIDPAGKIVPNLPMRLPKGAKPLSHWTDNPSEDFLNVLKYMSEDRNPDLLKWHEYYWTPDTEYNMNRRIIIPFKSDYNNFLYGYSARSIDPKLEPKYIAKYNNGYLFGQENLLKPNRRYAIVTEGIFDSIAISGCATMKQTMTEGQIITLKNCEKQVIILPDRDHSGKELVLQALENNFSVSMPDWPDDYIKDADDAVKKYGRIPALKKIIDNTETNELKIKLKMKHWFKD